jgi:hypothetical protein
MVVATTMSRHGSPTPVVDRYLASPIGRSKLKAASLVRGDGRPLVPVLFWSSGRSLTDSLPPSISPRIEPGAPRSWRAGTRRSSLVSGEQIVLAGDSDGNAARSVRATARLGDADLGPHALVAGSP